MSQQRIVVIDDHLAVRKGIIALLGQLDWAEVVGEAGTAEEGADLIRSTEADIAVVDIRMPGKSGIDLLAELEAEDNPTRVVLMTAFREPALVRSAVTHNVAGFVSKDAPVEIFNYVMTQVRDGNRAIDPSLTAALIAHDDVALSDRQREVLTLMARGMMNDEIASRLGVGVETVKTHVSQVLHKLDATSRTQAVVKALKESLVALDDL